MNAPDFEQIVVAYLDKHVAPMMPLWKQLGLAMVYAGRRAELHSFLEACGVEKKGVIDTDKLREVLTAAFEKVPDVYIEGIGTFQRNDAETFFAMLPKEATK